MSEAIKTDKLLLVEGKDEENLFSALLEYLQMNTSNQSSLDKVCLVQKFKPLRVWFH